MGILAVSKEIVETNEEIRIFFFLAAVFLTSRLTFNFIEARKIHIITSVL